MTTLMKIQTQYPSMDDAQLAHQAALTPKPLLSYIAVTSRASIAITWCIQGMTKTLRTSPRRPSWPRWRESTRIAGQDLI